MEIVSLRLVLTEDDLNSLVSRFVTMPPKIRDLRARIIATELALAGVYDSFLPIHFETLWKVSFDNGKIAARLSAIKAVGVGLGFLKNYVLKAMSSNSTLFELKDESLVFDLDRLLADMTVPIKTNLAAISFDSECLVLECQR